MKRKLEFIDKEFDKRKPYIKAEDSESITTNMAMKRLSIHIKKYTFPDVQPGSDLTQFHVKRPSNTLILKNNQVKKHCIKLDAEDEVESLLIKVHNNIVESISSYLESVAGGFALGEQGFIFFGKHGPGWFGTVYPDTINEALNEAGKMLQPNSDIIYEYCQIFDMQHLYKEYSYNINGLIFNLYEGLKNCIQKQSERGYELASQIGSPNKNSDMFSVWLRNHGLGGSGIAKVGETLVQMTLSFEREVRKILEDISNDFPSFLHEVQHLRSKIVDSLVATDCFLDESFSVNESNSLICAVKTSINKRFTNLAHSHISDQINELIICTQDRLCVEIIKADKEKRFEEAIKHVLINVNFNLEEKDYKCVKKLSAICDKVLGFKLEYNQMSSFVNYATSQYIINYSKNPKYPAKVYTDVIDALEGVPNVVSNMFLDNVSFGEMCSNAILFMKFLAKNKDERNRHEISICLDKSFTKGLYNRALYSILDIKFIQKTIKYLAYVIKMPLLSSMLYIKLLDSEENDPNSDAKEQI